MPPARPIVRKDSPTTTETRRPCLSHSIHDACERRLVACLLGLVLISLLASSAAMADNVVVTPTDVTLANAAGSTR